MLHMWFRELIRTERLNFPKETISQNLLELLLVCGLGIGSSTIYHNKPYMVITY